MPPTRGHHAYYRATKSVRGPGGPNRPWKSLTSACRRSTPTQRPCREKVDRLDWFQNTIDGDSGGTELRSPYTSSATARATDGCRQFAPLRDGFERAVLRIVDEELLRPEALARLAQPRTTQVTLPLGGKPLSGRIRTRPASKKRFNHGNRMDSSIPMLLAAMTSDCIAKILCVWRKRRGVHFAMAS
jgi:hypothetical protein